MKSITLKNLWPHLVALLIFAAVSSIYFYPVLQGYGLKQLDIKQHKGMGHEIKSHKADLDEEPLWTGNMFGGMPAYQITAIQYNGNIIDYIHKALQLGFAHPINILILYMIGFYIFLLCLRINPWLSIIGALAFAFSSYFIIIIEAGHNTKALAIAYMPAVLGGIISILRGRVWVGVLITTIFMALELKANHFQITYYLIFTVLAVGLVEMFYQIKAGQTQLFFKRAGIVVIAVILGILPNIGNLLTTYEYSKASTRSPSELTITASGETNEHNKSTGLDKDYITRWSNGIGESFSLLLPNVKGAKSGAILGDEEEVQRLRREDPQFFNFMVSQYQNEQFLVNTYWGNQPFTSGSVYAGAIICFLAFLALFFVKDRLTIGLGIAAILALLLSWGKNFMGFTEFFIDYVPLYNKFRAVSMTLVVVEMVLPALAILFLAKIYQNRTEIFEQKKRLYTVSGAFVGLLLLFWMMPDTFFEFLSDKEMQHLNTQLSSNEQQSNMIYAGFESVKNYRIDIFKADVIRALQFIVIAFVLMLLFLTKKLNKNIMIAGIGLLIFVDLWTVDKTYINNKQKPGASITAADRYLAYEPISKKIMPYNASTVDKAILQKEVQQNPSLIQKINDKLAEDTKEKGVLTTSDVESVEYTQLMRATHYRVLNTTKRLDEDAQTAYFHKTLGGYHAAKLKKYQELIDFQLGYEHFQLSQVFLQGGEEGVKQYLPNMVATNMLNAKYIIGAVNAEQGQRLTFVQNPYALGNAWFVEDYKIVPNADEEILALKELNPGKTVIVREEDKGMLADNYQKNAGDYIRLKSYLPNKLVYEYQAASKQLAVFSEIYYNKGWTAYLNGEELPYIKVNYILRGMELPEGGGELVFIFDPISYEIGRVATWASSILILLLGGVVYRKKFRANKNSEEEEQDNN